MTIVRRIAGPGGGGRLADLTDVDETGAQVGSLLAATQAGATQHGYLDHADVQVAARTGGRPGRAARGDVRWYAGTAAAAIALTERDRLSMIVRNLSASQTLQVALGTLDVSTTPSSFTDVPPGSEWVTTDVRPVFARYASSADLVHVVKEVAA